MGSTGATAVPVQAVLFDLDGTLSDGAAGMLASLAQACRAVGLDVPPEATLRRFIGPPFEEAFADHFGLGPAGCERALAAYRRHYVDGGAMLEASPYPGVASLLAGLRARGILLAVATSKPAVYARRVVEHLRLDHFLAGVFGPPLEGPSSKAAVVAMARAALDLSPATTVMVGDRRHDVLGATANAMASVGVLWGHGTRAELEEAGAVAVVEDPAALAELLDRWCAEGGRGRTGGPTEAGATKPHGAGLR